MKRPIRVISSLFILTLSLGLVSHSFIPFNVCTSTIKTNKQYFSISEPIFISYSIKNVSRDTIRIWHCGFWCNNKIVMTDINNNEIPRTELGKSTLLAFSPGGDRDKNFPVVLGPNKIDAAYESYNLKDHFLFKKSGVYKVTYLYHEKDGNGEMKVQSNTLRIQIND
jgi:hypothetical protein